MIDTHRATQYLMAAAYAQRVQADATAQFLGQSPEIRVDPARHVPPKSPMMASPAQEGGAASDGTTLGSRVDVYV